MANIHYLPSYEPPETHTEASEPLVIPAIVLDVPEPPLPRQQQPLA